MARHVLGPAEDFEELDTRGYQTEPGDARGRFFVVRKNGRFHAYVNTCPHAGAPLNWQGDRFLSFDRRFIQCALHGAMFNIENGACIAGPCPGAALEALPVTVEDGQLVVEL